tara:strand:+ start:179 stop:343 length:165 start_codon:yes stop_codon:yes gene_type:complete
MVKEVKDMDIWDILNALRDSGLYTLEELKDMSIKEKYEAYERTFIIKNRSNKIQ